MFQKSKSKRKKRAYESITGLRNREKQVKNGGRAFPAGHCFSTVSDRMTASAGCRGISVVFSSLSKVSWCLLLLFSFFFSLRSRSGSSRSSLSCDLVCSFFGSRGSRAKLRGQTVRSLHLCSQQHSRRYQSFTGVSPSVILIKERADL